MDKLLSRLVDTTSVLNITNGTTVTGTGIIAAGMAIAHIPEPNAAAIGGVVIVFGVIVSLIKGN